MIPNSVLYKLMMQIDRYEDLDHHPLRESEAYELAVKELGWHIDWEQEYEKRQARYDQA